MTRGRWLLHEHVQRSTGNCATRNCIIECLLIDETTTSTIDYARALLHLCDCLAVNQTTRFGGQRSVDGEKVSPRVNLIKRCQLDLQIACVLRCKKRIVGDDLHAHRACT